MWVFGYGSLMWDGWEETQGCVRRTRADLSGYRRVFNKASVRNWGTKEFPGPTLNLIKSDSAHCCGMAFEFPNEREQEIRTYLAKREGKGFALRQLPAKLIAGDGITAIVPIYEGNNLIHADRVEQISDMVRQASGKDGRCICYVKGIAAELHRLGIDDPAVSDLWQALRSPRTNSA
jgi:cation transport protein ChaC